MEMPRNGYRAYGKRALAGNRDWKEEPQLWRGVTRNQGF